MSLAKVFDKLGQKIVPQIAAKVFPDTMVVLQDSTTSDGAGGQIYATATEGENGDPIPCTYEPRGGVKSTIDDKTVSKTQYVIVFPTNQFDYLLDITTGDRLKVLARGNQPDKIFKVINIANDSGVVNEATCELEDAI